MGRWGIFVFLNIRNTFPHGLTEAVWWAFTRTGSFISVVIIILITSRENTTSLYFNWGKWHPERLGKLPEVTQHVGGWDWIQIPVYVDWKMELSPRHSDACGGPLWSTARGHRAVVWPGACSSITRQIHHPDGHVLFPFCSTCCADKTLCDLNRGLQSRPAVHVCEKAHSVAEAAVARCAVEGCWPEGCGFRWAVTGGVVEAQAPGPTGGFQVLLNGNGEASVLVEKQLLSQRPWGQ